MAELPDLDREIKEATRNLRIEQISQFEMGMVPEGLEGTTLGDYLGILLRKRIARGDIFHQPV